MKKLPLSLVVITKNEQKNIERCLRSVPFASEIILVDSGSTDQTCVLAEAAGATVFQKEWMGFGLQKKHATSLARFDWIISLDADEALSPELAAEIQARFEELEADFAYALPRRSFHLGRWICYGGWFPDYQTRIYNRKVNNWSEDPIHEKVRSGKIAYFKNPILHWVFKDLSHQVATNDRYSTLQAQQLDQKGLRFSYFKLLTKPPTKFIECYFLKRGLLDGWPGFMIAVSAAYSVFLKWGKLWEIQTLLQDQKK
jgi:glycosyltransferase involved in cell wall biosynthesis